MTQLGLTRLFLHAFSIRFEHPKTGETLRINAPLDPEMKRSWAHCVSKNQAINIITTKMTGKYE